MQTKVQKAFFIFVLCIIMSLPTLLNNSASSFLPVESQRSFLDRLLVYPFYVFKIIFYEIAQLLVLDRILFFMLILSVFYSIRYFYRDSSKYFIFSLIAGFLTGALNGTVGVNFRYQLPTLIFMCWSIIDNMNLTIKGFSKRSD
jgi:CDP-diglyceride synthetase